MAILYPPTQNGLQKTLDAQLNQGETSSLTLNNVTGIQNKPGVILINRIDANGNEKTSSLREWVKYTAVSGSTLTGLTRAIGGSTDQEHAVGSVVEFVPDISVFQAIIDAITVANNDVFLDEDAMGSDSATKGATQQSIKAYADGKIAKPGSEAQGDVLYYNGTMWTRLGAGTNGQYLQTQGAGANPQWATIASTALSSKVITATRDLTAATGNVAYTGVGFTPTSIMAIAYVEAGVTSSTGFADSAKAGGAIGPYTSFAMTGGNYLIYALTSAGVNQTAVVDSYDADGFTLTWTKTGSPTGTLNIKFICFK